MGDLSEPGSVDTGNQSSSSLPVSRTNTSPLSIGAEKWALAERAAQQIMDLVQPTLSSEEKRKNVMDYIEKLIIGIHGCKVFPFGSVPLKTYLPDGDIDLTAFSGTNNDDFLVPNVVAALEREAQNDAAEFKVYDVQLIPAEVKLIKCLIQNIVVDISFNQLGGLYTLCFLEQIDRFIGKDHLFKRSIILIKAWCFHESRVLGAHHGLISTYALETLVLYLFHHFHSVLDGPLSVLYKFLDYFSKFNWEHYCITLNGPSLLSSLPQIVAEKPENGGEQLLLSDDIVQCIFGTSVIPLGNQNSRMFPRKHMNIVDPLKENNNLGRSINQGNFFRIQSAFTHGAKQLGRILLGSEVNIAEEMNNFFSTTLGRHGTGVRPDAQESASISGSDTGRNLSGFSDLNGDIDTQFRSLDVARWCCESAKAGPAMFMPPSQLHGLGAHSIHFRPDFFEMNPNMGVPRNTLYRPNPLLVQSAQFGLEELPKSRGTGTYFPNVNRAPYISGNGRYQGNARFSRNVNEASFHDRGNNFAGQSSSSYVPNIPDAQVYAGINVLYPHQASDYRQVGYLPQAVNLSEQIWQPRLQAAHTVSQPALPEQMWQPRLQTAHAVSRPPPLPEQIWQPRPQTAHAVTQPSQSGQDLPQSGPVVVKPDRLTEASSSYLLKNDDDFPPLSM